MGVNSSKLGIFIIRFFLSSIKYNFNALKGGSISPWFERGGGRKGGLKQEKKNVCEN